MSETVICFMEGLSANAHSCIQQTAEEFEQKRNMWSQLVAWVIVHIHFLKYLHAHLWIRPFRRLCAI